MAVNYKDKWWGEYLSPPINQAGPRIRDKGFPVWSLVGFYQLYAGDREQILYDYCGELTAAELDAALAYYAEFPEVVDRKLAEIAG